MAVQLYKSGNTHVVKGVQCELINTEENDLEMYLRQGYVFKVEDLLIELPHAELPSTEVFVIPERIPIRKSAEIPIRNSAGRMKK